jgi:eukaryotic-like serine/threonine-protein kinase
VTLHDGVPVPKVIDFGIAKATNSELTDKTVYTAFEQFIGTPGLHESRAGRDERAGHRHAQRHLRLGVLLYELLTAGRRSTRSFWSGIWITCVGSSASRRSAGGG